MDVMLHDLIGDLKSKESKNAVSRMIDAGTDYEVILNELVKGLEIVGERYEEGRYFIADLIVSGMIIKEIFHLVNFVPFDLNIKKTEGTVVIGTVYEDIHDIGKDLVIDALKVYGFDVIDLGTNVSNETFLDAIDQYHPDILAISCVMSSSFKYVIRLCNILKEKNMTDAIKVIVGGAGISKALAATTSVPFMTSDLFEGIEFCINNIRHVERDIATNE